MCIDILCCSVHKIVSLTALLAVEKSTIFGVYKNEFLGNFIITWLGYDTDQKLQKLEVLQKIYDSISLFFG